MELMTLEQQFIMPKNGQKISKKLMIFQTQWFQIRTTLEISMDMTSLEQYVINLNAVHATHLDLFKS
jgi:hypothetical protein